MKEQTTGLNALIAKKKVCVPDICKPFQFLNHFFALLSVLRNERDHSTVMALVKKPVVIDSDAENNFQVF